MVSPKPVSLSVRKGHCRPGHQKCWSHGAPVCMGGAPFSGSMVMAGRQRAGGVTPRLTPGGPLRPPVQPVAEQTHSDPGVWGQKSRV